MDKVKFLEAEFERLSALYDLPTPRRIELTMKFGAALDALEEALDAGDAEGERQAIEDAEHVLLRLALNSNVI